MRFSKPVAFVYRPLDYAWAAHRQYLERFAGRGAPVLLVGMNPGPWGMVQTGVPFGEGSFVRDWLKIDAPIEAPEVQHPARPVLGLACGRSEVSGARLWGWARSRFGDAEAFFRRFFVANYCPLCFMEESGRNRTPDKLTAPERERLFGVCDAALRRLAEVLQPRMVIGVGAFAESRARAALGDMGSVIGRIPHPSPASPAANKGWAEQAERALAGLGIRLT